VVVIMRTSSDMIAAIPVTETATLGPMAGHRWQ
jgi:hypothetical protein